MAQKMNSPFASLESLELCFPSSIMLSFLRQVKKKWSTLAHATHAGHWVEFPALTWLISGYFSYFNVNQLWDILSLSLSFSFLCHLSLSFKSINQLIYSSIKISLYQCIIYLNTRVDAKAWLGMDNKSFLFTDTWDNFWYTKYYYNIDYRHYHYYP